MDKIRLVLTIVYVGSLFPIIMASFPSARQGQLKDRISDNYLVLLKHSQKENHAENFNKVTAFVNSMGLSSKGPTSCQGNFSIGELSAVRVTGHGINLDALTDHEQVELVEPLMEWRILDADMSNKDLGTCMQENTAKQLWGLSRISVRDKPMYSRAKYIYKEKDGDGVYIYVVDTGVYLDHEDFQGRAIWGYTSAGVRPTEGSTEVDNHGHGTHVAGTAAGTTYGVAKNANIIAVKVLDQNGVGSTLDILEGLNWVYQDFMQKQKTLGARNVKAVVNLSLGGFANEVSAVLEGALLQLIDAGMSVSVAAGNDASDACASSPARLGAAITVGATDVADNLASFSNYGPCVDVLGPGDDILSSYIGEPAATARFRGTSMSAPHVAGIVARFLSQQERNASPEEVKGWLLQTSTPGLIQLSSMAATPNRLLYMPCEAVHDNCVLDLSNFGYDGEVKKRDNIILWMSIGMGVLGLMTLVSLAVACSTRSSSKRSTGKGNSERQRILGYENRGAIYT